MRKYTDVYKGEEPPKRKDVLWAHHSVKDDLTSPVVVQIFSKGKWVDAYEGGGAEVERLSEELGDITDLKTTDKDSTVDAINEVVDNVGDLSDLTTTAKTDLVSAINEASTKGDPASLLYTAQSLTEAQKTQALANIGAASQQEFESLSAGEVVPVTELPNASDDTMGKIYLVGPDANDEYDRYISSYNGTNYSWVQVGTTKMDLSGYATDAEVSQLEAEVTDKFSEISPRLLRDSDGDGFQIADPNGYVGLIFKNGELDVTGVGENLEGIIKEIADDAIEETEVIEERAEQVVKTSDLTMRIVDDDGLFVVDADGYIGGVLFGDYGKGGELSVNVNLEQKTASFISVLSSKYLVKNTVRWEEDETLVGNPVMNFNGTSIIETETGTEKVINQESDNICPISFSKYENLGGNHGFSTKKVVCDTTGLGYSAIGKQLSCNGKECYIVRILSDGVILYPGHTGDTFKTLPISAGDTITGDGVSLSVTSASSVQVYPACISREKKLTIDGNTITESGDYVGNDVRFFDTYDIFDPISFLDNIIANAGSWTANPTLETADPDFLVRRSIMYQFVRGGLCLIYDNFSILKDTSIASEYGLNIKPMSTASVSNGVKKYYLPKSLPLVYDKTTGQRATESTAEANKVTFDFRTPTTQGPSAIPGFESLGDSGLNFIEEDCENGNPIERGVCVLDFDDGRILLHHGYAPGFDVSGDNRPKYSSRIWRMRALNDFWTIYPQAYRSGSELFPGPVSKGETYGYVCFRKYADGFNGATPGVLSVFDFRLGGDYYLYVDILSPGIYKVDIPADCYGKKVEVLSKRDNVSVLEAVATDCINISVSVSDSGVNYGYCLIKL